MSTLYLFIGQERLSEIPEVDSQIYYFFNKRLRVNEYFSFQLVRA